MAGQAGWKPPALQAIPVSEAKYDHSVDRPLQGSAQQTKLQGGVSQTELRSQVDQNETPPPDGAERFPKEDTPDAPSVTCTKKDPPPFQLEVEQGGPPVPSDQVPPPHGGGHPPEGGGIPFIPMPVIPGGTTVTPPPPITIPPPSPGFADPTVEVKTEVDPSPTDKRFISIKLNCAANPHFIQFIAREIRDHNNNLIQGNVVTNSGSNPLTTDPANPAWHLDHPAGSPTPYYEDYGWAVPQPGSLTMYDSPSTNFASLGFSLGETAVARFTTFAICGGHVVRAITWSRSQPYGGEPTYSDVNVANANALPAWATAILNHEGYAANIPPP